MEKKNRKQKAMREMKKKITKHKVLGYYKGVHSLNNKEDGKKSTDFLFMHIFFL